MKRTGMLVVCAMVLLCAGAAQANGIDPVIIVRGGSGTTPLPNLNPVPLTFAGMTGCTSGTWSAGVSDPTYFVNGLPFLSCIFQNSTGSIPFTSLTFYINPSGQALSLFNLPWDNTTYFAQTSSTPGDTSARFFEGVIPVGREFEVVLIGFSANTTVTMVANVPEPATLALFGTGLLAIATRLRKKRV